MKLKFILIAAILVSCKVLLPPSKRYQINENGIRAKTGCKIEAMSIAQFIRDDADVGDIRPSNHKEIARYCCWAKDGCEASSFISFKDRTDCYNWFQCKPDFSIVENDSLNKLSIEEKLAYVAQKEKLTSKYIAKEAFPFKIEKGYVYQIFGLCDIEGSYYLTIDNSNKLIVQYVDAGPF